MTKGLLYFNLVLFCVTELFAGREQLGPFQNENRAEDP